MPSQHIIGTLLKWVELFPNETWDFFDFLTPPPPLFGLIPKFSCFFDWKASLRVGACSRPWGEGGEDVELLDGWVSALEEGGRVVGVMLICTGSRLHHISV